MDTTKPATATAKPAARAWYHAEPARPSWAKALENTRRAALLGRTLRPTAK